MPKKTKVGFISLGCPKNRVDTERMLHTLFDAGYEITPEESEADVVIVNTCAFIESAKRESIDEILELAWLKENKNLKAIIAAGCLAERYKDTILDEMPEIDAAVGVAGTENIVEAVASALENAKKKSGCERYTSFPDKNSGELEGERILTTPEYSAYLKIGEGCSNRCTYCAIPLIRGRQRSRSIENIVSEAKELEALGVKELIVVAQDTTGYGEDLYGHSALPELLRAIIDATQIPWIRLLYCYPERITDELIQTIRDNPRICRYIDLPVQHVSDRVLRKMNRRGGESAVREAVKKLREKIPGIIIRSTLITGFPGETKEDFAALCDFVSEGGRATFDRLGVFAYSREEDTPAYDFPDQIEPEEAERRAEAVMELQARLLAKRSFKAHDVEVLCEGYDVVAETYYGRTYADAPEIDGKVFFDSPDRKIADGEFVTVHVNECDEYDLFGTAK